MTIQEQAKIAAYYKVRNFNVLKQRRWGVSTGRHETLHPEKIRACRAKLKTTGAVNDKRSRRQFTSQSAEKVKRVMEMFMRSLQKSTHQAVRESRLTRLTIPAVLHKELNYHPWNLHFLQELNSADGERRMEYGKLLWSWHGVYGEI